MNQLKALMESELLTTEVKEQLTEAVKGMKQEFEGKLEAEYASKMVTEAEKLEVDVKQLIEESVTAEISELKADIVKYRKLEIEYADKLETFKEEYQAKLSESVELFVTESVQEEVAELKQDLMEAKKEDFGRKIFEAYSETFADHGFGGDMKELSEKLKLAQSTLKEAETKTDSLLNEKIKSGLLESLSGKKAKIMETLLEGVSTDELEAKYNASIDFVLETKSSDNADQLNESDESNDESVSKGDRVDLNESVLSDERKSRLNELLGRTI